MSIDETYLHEWFEWGMTELVYYLMLHARFEQYLCENGRI